MKAKRVCVYIWTFFNLFMDIMGEKTHGYRIRLIQLQNPSICPGKMETDTSVYSGWLSLHHPSESMSVCLLLSFKQSCTQKKKNHTSMGPRSLAELIPTTHEDSLFQKSSQSFVVNCFLDIGHSERCKRKYPRIFIWELYNPKNIDNFCSTC